MEATRFVLEVAAVIALAVAGATANVFVAVAAPLALVGIWGRFVAPKSPRRLSDPTRLGVEIVLFAAVGVAMWAGGWTAVGLVIAAASATVAVCLRIAGSPS